MSRLSFIDLFIIRGEGANRLSGFGVGEGGVLNSVQINHNSEFQTLFFLCLIQKGHHFHSHRISDTADTVLEYQFMLDPRRSAVNVCCAAPMAKRSVGPDSPQAPPATTLHTLEGYRLGSSQQPPSVVTFAINLARQPEETIAV